MQVVIIFAHTELAYHEFLNRGIQEVLKLSGHPMELLLHQSNMKQKCPSVMHFQ